MEEQTPPRTMPTCPVCMDQIEFKDEAELKCRHDIHLSCALKLHSPTCPICRTRLKSDKLCEEDLRKMEVKHDEDVEAIDNETFEDVEAIDNETFEDQRSLEDLEEEEEEERWEREMMYLQQEARNVEIGSRFKEKAKDLLKEIGFEEFIRLSHTDDDTPAKVKLLREVKFLIYLRLYGGKDDFETRLKIFALMDQSEDVFTSFLRSKPLVVEKDFLDELSYQAYLVEQGYEDDIEIRFEMFELECEDMTFVRFLFVC